MKKEKNINYSNKVLCFPRNELGLMLISRKVEDFWLGSTGFQFFSLHKEILESETIIFLR
jgi:hypothetical protein